MCLVLIRVYNSSGGSRILKDGFGMTVVIRSGMGNEARDLMESAGIWERYTWISTIVLNPFRALDQCVVSTPGFTGGYSHSATSWLRTISNIVIEEANLNHFYLNYIRCHHERQRSDLRD